MGFAFNVPSFDQSVRSSLQSSGIPLGSSGGSSSPITYSGYLNGVRVVSNQAPSLYSSLNNLGSSITSSKANTDDNKLDKMLNTIGSAVAIGQGIYNIFNSERNYQNERSAYQDNLAYLNRVLSDQENAIVNQAEQYAKIGLNPLYMSGNGMSYSTGGFPDAPKHSNLENLAILNQMDSLKNSEASRALQHSQAQLNQTKSIAQSYVNLLNWSKILLNFKSIPKVEKQIENIVANTASKELDTEIKSFDFDYSKALGTRYKDSYNNWQKGLGMGLAGLNNFTSSAVENYENSIFGNIMKPLIETDPVTGLTPEGFKVVAGTPIIDALSSLFKGFKKSRR